MKTLLLVDDEPNQLASLKMLLKYSGINGLKFKLARSSDDAAALLGKGGIDLVLSDVNIGSGYGPDLKKMFSKVPFIYLTGDPRWKSPDGSALLIKPYEPDVIYGLIRKTLGIRESLSENIFRLTRLIANRDITVASAINDLLEGQPPLHY